MSRFLFFVGGAALGGYAGYKLGRGLHTGVSSVDRLTGNVQRLEYMPSDAGIQQLQGPPQGLVYGPPTQPVEQGAYASSVDTTAPGAEVYYGEETKPAG